MLSLKTTEIAVKDTGKAYAKLDPGDMRLLGVGALDLIEIGGKRKTVARVMPLEKASRGKSSTIEIDAITRENAKVAIDDIVFVKKAQIESALKVVLSPMNGDLLFNSEEAQYLSARLDGIPVTVGDKLRIALTSARIEDFQVLGTIPAESIVIRTSTKIEIRKKPKIKLSAYNVTYEDIGGLREQINKVREIVELPLKYPLVFERLGIEPPRGVLLIGHPGTGKTLLARAVARETNANFQVVNGPEIIHKFYGESEARLRDIFEVATRNQPSIIFIDELDAIAPKREKVSGDVEKRVVAQLLALMDGLKDRGRVVVIGATNLPNMLDTALRRPGRFDREVVLDVPDKKSRLEIFEIHTRGMPLSRDIDLDRLAEITHGFVGADIENLCREAAINALRGVIKGVDIEASAGAPDNLIALSVGMQDFFVALRGVEPSAIREIFVEVPKVSWEDVGGLREVKQKLIEAVIWPLEYRDLFESTATKTPKGILLYGPTGSGKTLLAKALAKESGLNFISIKGAELLSKYVGESEERVREVFKKAKQVSPCIVFFDEIDALASSRRDTDGARVSERVVSQLLVEMDGVEELRGVVALAATNRAELIDEAFLRSGRFDLFLNVPYPDGEALLEILKIHTRMKPLSKDVNLTGMTARLKGFSGADVELLCHRASMNGIRDHINRKRGALKITQANFDDALGEITDKINRKFSPPDTEE
ncbi:MAG: CDC48 family AAA ATPase [Deltaproteobacteria bacterium]